MLIARVIGTTVSTIKDEKLTGRKLLILRQTDETGSPTGKPYVAVDTVDAGIGDLVLTCGGFICPPDEHHQGYPGGRGHHGSHRFAGSGRQSGLPQIVRGNYG